MRKLKSRIQKETDTEAVGEQIPTASDSELQQLVETLCASLPQLLQEPLEFDKALRLIESVAREQVLRAELRAQIKPKKTPSTTVILGYPKPAGCGVNPRASARTSRKRGCPGYKIRLPGCQLKELRAVVECMGWNLNSFVTCALIEAKLAALHRLGLDTEEVVRLNKQAKTRLAEQFRSVQKLQLKTGLDNFKGN
jgi:hypothetical protein